MARVLVAEDESSLAELVKVNLEFEGHEVEVATDGRYALQAMVEDGPFDVVVLDLMMPWSDGFDFLHNIGRKHGGARVVVLTARDDGYTKARAADAGVDAYITKPYDPDVLAQKVSQLARVDKR